MYIFRSKNSWKVATCCYFKLNAMLSCFLQTDGQTSRTITIGSFFSKKEKTTKN